MTFVEQVNRDINAWYRASLIGRFLGLLYTCGYNPRYWTRDNFKIINPYVKDVKSRLKSSKLIISWIILIHQQFHKNIGILTKLFMVSAILNAGYTMISNFYMISKFLQNSKDIRLSKLELLTEFISFGIDVTMILATIFIPQLVFTIYMASIIYDQVKSVLTYREKMKRFQTDIDKSHDNDFKLKTVLEKSDYDYQATKKTTRAFKLMMIILLIASSILSGGTTGLILFSLFLLMYAVNLYVEKYNKNAYNNLTDDDIKILGECIDHNSELRQKASNILSLNIEPSLQNTSIFSEKSFRDLSSDNKKELIKTVRKDLKV